MSTFMPSLDKDAFKKTCGLGNEQMSHDQHGQETKGLSPKLLFEVRALRPLHGPKGEGYKIIPIMTD